MNMAEIRNVISAGVKLFINTNRIFFAKNETTRRCTPHFFIYQIPTKEINCKQTTKL